MKKIIGNLLIALIVITGGLMLSGQIAHAGEISNLLKDAGDKGKFNTSPTENTSVVAGRFISVFLSLLGVIFVCLMIYAGYLWMTAAGEEEKVNKAKDILTNAIIGLVLVVGAYIITYFITASISAKYFQNSGFSSSNGGGNQ